MKHLLLTRFQGALIGGNIIYVDRHQIAPNQLILDTMPALERGINSLIDRGKFDSQDWSQQIFIEPAEPHQAIVTMLPLMLFFHDDRIKLRETLINVSHGWQLDWETCSSAVAIGYIISRSLTESLNPRTIITQLLDEMTNLHPLIFQELSTIDRLLDRTTSLHRVAQRLATTEHPIIAPTLLAIYCFLSTPEDFSLATRRADRLDDRSQLTQALTGILAGAHNSLTEIPLNGYVATQERVQWLSLAQNLLGVWAGVDLHRGFPTHPAAPLAVAAPQVIQRRG
ncbi:ADP-ribosylglycohydrolase family protein [Chamaesiphon sp. GL140_3_metabinner_50]|uniref:ADP-ribosylglycohydrolase family protein n=1 Tax=Chamaesiphon sp. GL140_3_metabinner_50 TaxID=2970812 RepID=UPI0025D22099|nr:ADP-ribosylglycohydrolase family protein [Chamaesiphon sp. GL140_3_metabinner_50]